MTGDGSPAERVLASAHHSSLISHNRQFTVCQIRHIMPSHAERNKPLAWLRGEIKTPPFSAAARVEAGVLLRRLQRGESLAMPHSRPMPIIGNACHELRVRDADTTWRIL